MISEKLSSAYTALEDKYFNLLDALDHRGIPVYAYSDFFEDKGIPSFIVTIAIIVAIILLLSLAFTGPLIASGEITLNIRDSQTGQPLQNITLSIYTSNDLPLSGATNLIVSDGDKINIASLPTGTKLTLSASIDGYQPIQKEIMLGSNNNPTLNFDKAYVGIPVTVKLYNSETNTKIVDAVVSARYDTEQFNFFKDSNGSFRSSNIPEGEIIILTIASEGYNDLEETVSFFNGQEKSFFLTPSDQGYVDKSSLIVTVSNETGNTIENAEVTIYNKNNQTILLDTITEQGAISGLVQTNVPIRITVKKDGYLFWDSDVKREGITLIKTEEKIDVILEQGGEELTVNVVNSLGLSLSNAVVQVFNENGERMFREVTTTTGATFTGLDPNSTVIITASRESYLPNQIIVDVGITESVPIILSEAIASNSARLDIFTLDEFGDPVNGANIKINFFKDTNKIPYGLDDFATSVAGYVSVIVGLNNSYEINAETNVFEGKKLIDIGNEIVDNKVYINMKRKPDVIEMKLLNIYGGPIYGTATIDALDGTELYDGNISNSRIFFDALGKDVVELRVKTEDGNIFTENVLVSENYVEVIVYDKGADALKPSIEFVGFETETGKEVQGITPGAFYWAKFNVVWPIAAQSGGIHIRTGKDDSTIVDEDKIALFELSLPSSTKYYSYSYNPLPAPGNEILDRSNQSFEGETSKWVEGVVKNPKGSYTAKVRVRASDFTAGKLSLKYRAWSSIQDEYYRNPEDNIIGNDAFNEEKAGLYANTNEEEIVVYESLPECSDELCVAFNFVDDSEVYRDLEGFEALKGRVYALEAEFSSQQTDFLQVNISTDSNIVFIGTQVSNFNFLENNGVGQNNASTTISLTANGKQRARFYFVANSTGTNVLNFVAAGNNAIEKTISFNSAEEGQLIVELSESTVMLGRNFTVRVLDSGLRGVENALVKILDKKGEVVKSMSGEGTDGRGKNGNYRIENDLGTGLYIVQVSAPKYLTQETNLLITTTNVLSFADEINVKMLVNEKQKIVTEKLTNNSDFTINDIIVDVENSENFKVSVVSVPLLGKQQTQTLQIMVEFIEEGDEAEENITLNIKGLIEGKFLTQISSIMNVSYNRKLDSSCLKMEPSSLKINLIGSQGSSDSDTIEVTNNCDQPVFLQNRVKENTKRSFVVVTSEDISLQPGQTSDITITANNLVERQFARNESYGFSVIYDSNYLTKTLNVTIELINPSIALSYPGQVTLFLAQDRPTGKAIAAQPIFVTNVSQFPVEGISFSVDKAEYSQGGNVKITVEPPGTSNLEKGQSINPPKLVFGEASSKASEPTRAKISIRGRLGQLNNRVGQRDNYNNYLSFASGSSSLSNYNSSVTGYTNSNDLLGVIDVIAYYSGLDCLKVSVVNSTFNLSAEGLPRSATISVQNDCAEPVRITEANIKSQDIVIGLQSIVVMPGTLAHANISILANRGNVKLKNFPVIIRGITETSQTLIEAKPFNINVFAGVEFNDEYSKATKGISVNVCGQDTKETIDVPRDSSDCSNGYCDAEQAAEYIAKKLDQAIRKAESQAYSAQNTNESMACLAQGYCSFDQIGTQVIDFGLYMKNDDLSVSVLEDAFDKISSGSTGFNGLSGGDYIFQRAAITDEFLGEIARFGLGRQVFIDEDLSGCGYYNLSINGAFPVTGEGVAFTIPTLTIRVAGGMKIDTKECKNSIENLVNFTPVDEGYSLSNTGGTWLTSINAENSLKNMATQLSSKLLKSETRVGEGNGNKIILKEGALAGSLAEVCLQDGKQKIINVTVASSAKSMNETERKAFENQVAKMVSDTIKGSFGENCLVKNSDGYSCVKLTDVSGIGKLKLELDSKELPLSKSGGCVSGEISSNVPEGIEFEIITDNKDKKFSNITKIVVSEDKENGEKYFEINFQGDTISKTEGKKIVLEEIANRRENPFTRKIRVCAYPGNYVEEDHSEGLYVLANGSEFIVKAINKAAGDARGTSDEEGRIKVTAGTLHPDDLIELVNTSRAKLNNGTGKEHPYYFTVMWKDSINPIDNFMDYYLNVSYAGLRPEDNVQDKDGTTRQNKAVVRAEQEESKKAITKYLEWCVGVSMVCNAGTGPWNVGFGALFDCGIPAMTMFRDDVSEAWTGMRGVYDWLDDLPLIGSTFKLTNSVSDPRKWSPIINPAVATGAVGGGLERLALDLVRYSGTTALGVLNPNVMEYAKNTMKTAYTAKANTVATSFISRVNAPIATRFADEYSTFLADTFEESLQTQYKEAVARKGVLQKLRAFSEPLVTDKEYADMLIKAKEVAEGRSGEFFTTHTINGRKPAEYLLTNDGVNPFDLTDLERVTDNLNPGSKIKRAATGLDPLNSIDAKISSKVGVLTGDATIDMARGRAYSAIDGLVDDMASELGMSITQKVDFRAEIINQFDGLATRTGLVAEVPTIHPRTGARTYSYVYNSDAIKDNIKQAIRNTTQNTTRTTYDDIFRLTDDKLDNLFKASFADDIVVDAAKPTKGLAGKIKNLLNARVLGSIARGVGCGILSNAAGLWQYKKALTTYQEERKNGQAILPEQTLLKGETYQMIIDITTDGQWKINLEVMDTPEEKKQMSIDLEEKQGKKVTGKFLTSKLVTNTSPENRILRLFKLSANPDALRRPLNKNEEFDGIVEKIIAKVTSPNAQTVIYNYTNDSSKRKLVYNNFYVPESWAATIIAIDDYTEGDLEAEIKSKEGEGKIEKRLLALAREIETTGKGYLTEEVATKIMNNPEKAKQLYKLNILWEGILGSSKVLITEK